MVCGYRPRFSARSLAIAVDLCAAQAAHLNALTGSVHRGRHPHTMSRLSLAAGRSGLAKKSAEPLAQAEPSQTTQCSERWRLAITFEHRIMGALRRHSTDPGNQPGARAVRLTDAGARVGAREVRFADVSARVGAYFVSDRVAVRPHDHLGRRYDRDHLLLG